MLNRGVCIAMDVNTGAILAMVTVDGYDLNDPYTLPKETRKKIDALAKINRRRRSEALSAMWRNKAITDTYMPGSVFKCVLPQWRLRGKVNDNSTLPAAAQW